MREFSPTRHRGEKKGIVTPSITSGQRRSDAQFPNPGDQPDWKDCLKKPLHVWLPSSHAIAPSHVSAILSGVIIKMGVYGLVRITSLLPNPPLEWGAVLLGLGVVSGVLGVAFAIGQHDLKRLLPRMQYTSSSFAQMLVGLFGWALRPRTRRPKDLPLFPQKTEFHSEVPDTVLDEAVLPTFRFAAWLFSWLRVFQQGSIQTYVLYIFLALIALLLWRW